MCIRSTTSRVVVARCKCGRRRVCVETYRMLRARRTARPVVRRRQWRGCASPAGLVVQRQVLGGMDMDGDAAWLSRALSSGARLLTFSRWGVRACIHSFGSGTAAHRTFFTGNS
jgi:hypothetical protein